MTSWAVPFGQYIDGAWRPGGAGAVLEDRDPFTGALVAEIPLANVADLDAAYAAAARAQKAWGETPPAVRHGLFLRLLGVMDAHRAQIVDWLIREAGSTRMKAEMEWASVRAQIVEASSLPYRMEGRILPTDVPGKESRVYRKPLGVIGVISPWNWPFTLSHRSIAAALALGNAVVVKPADDTPVTGGLMIAKLYEEAGLPPGLLNVVIGRVEDIGDAFTLHDTPRFISFTGSTPVGRRIARLAAESRRLKGVALELGGNAPFVVLADADINQAARAAVFGRFLHQGQICMSTNRIIVEDAVHDAFLEAFTARVRTLKIGDPAAPDTIIGPLINARQLDRLAGVIAGAKAAGFRCLLGGDAQGQVLPPHVFADVDNDSALAQGELFGPVVPVIRARDEDHALALANATEYGLASAVFTGDVGRGLAFAHRLDCGFTHINDATVHSAPNAPFGGEKNSGLGRFGGDWIIKEFTSDHLVTIQSTPRAYAF